VLNKKIADANGRLAKLLAASTSVSEIIKELYLVTFCRPPDEEELRAAESLIGVESAKEGLQDLLWALLNSHEFMFNH